MSLNTRICAWLLRVNLSGDWLVKMTQEYAGTHCMFQELKIKFCSHNFILKLKFKALLKRGRFDLKFLYFKVVFFCFKRIALKSSFNTPSFCQCLLEEMRHILYVSCLFLSPDWLKNYQYLTFLVLKHWKISFGSSYLADSKQTMAIIVTKVTALLVRQK